MEVHILGTAGYFPTSTRHTLCVFLPEPGILLDAGTGLFRIRPLAATETLRVFLSHTHLDHVVGLTYLLGLAPRCGFTNIYVHALPEKLAAIRDHLFAPDLFPVMPPVHWRRLEQEVPLPGQGRLTMFPLDHPGGSVGFRLDWPTGSLAYVTDTTPRADYTAQIRGVDLLLHECNFNDDQRELALRTGHSWTRAVGRVAREADVGRLVLFHVDPLAESDRAPIRMDEVREVFPEAELAEDEMVLRL